MKRYQLACQMFLATCLSALVILTGCGGGSGGNGGSGSHDGPGKIDHVVIVFQENRSPDNLFQDPVLIERRADIQNYGYTSNGTKVDLTPVPLQVGYDLGHSHSAFLDACDWNGTQCVMDGADKIPCTGAGCPNNASYQYVSDPLIQPYYTMAETYTFGDRMFQTNEGPSFPAHQYILSGTSAVCVPGGNCPPGTTSSVFVEDNPIDDMRPDGNVWAGCLAPTGAVVNFIDTSQPFPNSDYSQFNGPECFEHPTLTDVLDSSGLTWKYYAAMPGSIWTSPNVIEHMCQPTGSGNNISCNGPDWTGSNPKVVIEGTGAQVVTDIQNGQLANVTWIIPDGSASDHPQGNKGLGPSWVASIVNAIGQSPFWADTAIIVTWDDWGGWYDHVPPTIHSTNSYEFGLRVPLIVISPYAKPAYVSHQVNDFGSILKFIEKTFSIPEINPSVGYADSYALGDMSDCFDFNQTPLTFTPVQAPVDKEYFLHNKAKPTPPDND
jgi:phospholipase C